MSHNKSVVGSLIVLSFLLLTFAGCSKAEKLAPAFVLERAYAATTEEVTSFRFMVSGAVTAEGMEEIDVMEGDGAYLAPDRMQSRLTFMGELQENITIGNKKYIKWKWSESRWMVEELPQDSRQLATGFGRIVDSKHNLEFMKSPGENVTQLDDDVVDGVECWRYRIAIDFDPAKSWIEKMEKETDPEMKAMFQEMAEAFREMEMTLEVEVWIGKEDYLVRQTRYVGSQKAFDSQEFDGVTIPEGTRYTMTTTTKFSGFNEPVEIEAPAGAVEAGPDFYFDRERPTPTPLPKP